MLSAILLAATLSLDGFVASAAYGARNIRITLAAALMIDLIGTGFLLLALLAAQGLKALLPLWLERGLGVGLLAAFGVKNLMEGSLKKWLRGKQDNTGRLRFRFMDFSVVLKVYLSPEKADADHSQTLSAKEAVVLGVALSLDSLATGLGGGLAAMGVAPMALLAAAFQLAAIYLGCWAGRRFAAKAQGDLSWLSGLLLLTLALLRCI